MSQEYEYFYEDEVYRFNRNGQLQLGMVLENAELVSSDEESDLDEDDRVTKGNIRVAWYPKGEELVVSERKVRLADRSLMPGDVVRRLIKGRDTQRGYCRHVRVMARVQLVMGGRQVLPSVNSVNLTPLEDFVTDMAICLDSWVGMVNMVKLRLLITTNDGSKGHIADHAAALLTDVRDTRAKDCEFRRYDFYPGQCLSGGAKKYEEVEWLHVSATLQAKLDAKDTPSKRYYKIRATVQEVEVQQLGVRWLCRAFSNEINGDTTPPKYLVMGDSLKRVHNLNVFEPCTLQLGDRNHYTIKENEIVMPKRQWDRIRASYTKNSPTLSEFLNIPNGGVSSNADIQCYSRAGSAALEKHLETTENVCRDFNRIITSSRNKTTGALDDLTTRNSGLEDKNKTSKETNTVTGTSIKEERNVPRVTEDNTRDKSVGGGNSCSLAAAASDIASALSSLAYTAINAVEETSSDQRSSAVASSSVTDKINTETIKSLALAQGSATTSQSAVSISKTTATATTAGTSVATTETTAAAASNTVTSAPGKTTVVNAATKTVTVGKTTSLADNVVTTTASRAVGETTLRSAVRDKSDSCGSSGLNVSTATLDHLSNDDDEKNYVDIDASDEDDDTASLSSNTSTSSFGASGKKKSRRSSGPALMTRMLKKKKLHAAKRCSNTPTAAALTPGDKVVVETLMTTSYADVVWQDGSVEFGIPSSQLYPIHHLDDQEFFPGDFVVEQKPSAIGVCCSGEDVDPHEYGVVQRVDHAGRTTIVKWFRTYTAGAEPQPILKCEQEVSVYDLRDHPDFRYRPGSVVIRVANFDNDQTCTAGQVLDNFPTGQVNVWWVDGSSSVCFPQDLYKVGEYDSDEGELWEDGDDSSSNSDDGKSWQTASGDEDNSDNSMDDCNNSLDSVPLGNQQLKTRLVANIEKARIAMSRLEEIFTQNPGLQSTQVMRQLLDCYKACRCMDKLMSTRFFHESNFAGLVEKVRERGRASSNQKMAEQFNRLFTSAANDSISSLQNTAASGLDNEGLAEDDIPAFLSDAADKCILNHDFENGTRLKRLEISTAELVNGSDKNNDQVNYKSSDEKPLPKSGETEIDKCKDFGNLDKDASVHLAGEVPQAPQSKQPVKSNAKSSCIGGNNLFKRLSESDMLGNHHNTLDSKTKRPISYIKDSKSLNDIKNSTTTKAAKVSDSELAQMTTNSASVKERRCSSNWFANITSNATGTDATDADNAASEVPNNSDSNAGYTSSMCAVLCCMMKAQLLKTYEEAVSRYGGHFDMSNIHANQLKADAAASDKTEATKLLQVAASAAAENQSLVTEETTADAAMKTTEAVINQISNKLLQDVLEVTSTSIPPALPDTSPPASPIIKEAAKLPSPVKSTTAEVASKVSETAKSPSVSVVPLALKNTSDCGSFMLLDSAPDSHKFKLTMLQPSHPSHFYKTVKNEMRLLQSSLPPGIWVRGYQDRMDLYSVMIRGPSKTPYQDGLFLFDFQLSADYPHAPPLCNYIPYCSDRLNPNLYEDGKVCVSLLGTWSGKGTEVWTHKSNLLQVIISIQGLILVSEPYFNEAGYERQKGSQQGHENSRMYNEMVLLKLIQATARMQQTPPSVFYEEILEHFNCYGGSMICRLERWLQISECHNTTHPLSPTTPNTYRSIITDSEQQSVLPEFPLIPASKGFCLTLRNTIPQVRTVFDQVLKPGWDDELNKYFPLHSSVSVVDAHSIVVPSDSNSSETAVTCNSDTSKSSSKQLSTGKIPLSGATSVSSASSDSGIGGNSGSTDSNSSTEITPPKTS